MPVLRPGGLEILVKTLVHYAHESNEVFLVSMDDPEAISVSDINKRLSAHYHLPSTSLNRKISLDLLKWIREQNIDVCHFHLSGTYGWETRYPWICPITIIARAGIPVITTNHSAYCFFRSPIPHRPLWKRWATAIRDWPGKAIQLALTRCEISVSDNNLELTRKVFPMFDHKLQRIYHSRLDNQFYPSAISQSRVILNVGTVAFLKGQHLLVEAFSKIAEEFPDWSLRLVGKHAENSCVDAIRRIIIEAGLIERVQLEGSESNPESSFKKAEIYVQPSMIEGFGLALQEAMFHGLPCIGSATGGIPELICDTSLGILYPAGDVAALAEALRKMILNPEQRLQMGTAAAISIRDRGMTREAMCNNYQSLYRTILNNDES